MPPSTPGRSSSAPPTTPERRKRTYDDLNLSSDAGDAADGFDPAIRSSGASSPQSGAAAVGTSATLHYSTSNLHSYTEKESKRLKLDAAEIQSVHAFNKSGLEKKLAQILMNQVVIMKVLGHVEEGKKQWEGPSENLKTNIKKYAHAVLVAPDLHGYRDKPAFYVLAILKKFRFDLPKDIEKDHAQWKKVEQCCGVALTSRRRVVKDEIKESKDVDLWTLTENVIGTCGTTSLEIAARVAIMRYVLFERGIADDSFWRKVDEELQEIREEADGDNLAASGALKYYIDNDLVTYGKAGEREEINYNATVPSWIQEVHDIVRGVGSYE
ncbi:hypothetical protein NEOLEDRAFT_1151559 [Neolentinus lepideus HHB14362 ss-1]|uniref:Uncharacterized protein n=1 Tax=Neolentinus lepideus HHB14362 ss-1 TaxID=1314782 RepID=A0A165NTL0_9AGAM|nr:hypothetical protein NEOLEDRAFT_1151559 [Neolentinus lepideus HHB14362 ss-1]